MTERRLVPLIFERSTPGRRGYRLPELDVPEVPVAELIPEEFLREEAPALPEVSELEVVRHYTQLSRLNHGVDVGFYPLGSCTMKYNPRVHEDVTGMPGFAAIHPYQPEETVQGAMELMYNLGEYLATISGLHATTLQPAAGAHGELTGLLVIKAYHKKRGEDHRREMIIPDSAHGTNPASCAMVGYKVIEVPSDERGGVNVEALRGLVGPNTAGLMLTNPNTLGLFDENICEIAKIVHDAGGLLYYDGANANAIMGIARPGDMGFDVVHFNLHKTFSTPHGGGGPGAGPIVVCKDLAQFLPGPVVKKDGDKYRFVMPENSIGRVGSFYGNFLVYAKAYAYIRSHGPEGLREVSETAVLHANYMMNKLKDIYHLPYDRTCMHEFVLSGSWQKDENGVRTLDIAKRLLDHGYHAPTVYFPMVVDEAIMIEPTETEPKSTLDEFIEVMRQIAEEAKENPELLKTAPHTTPLKRLDEARAARQPVLRWEKPE
ncbi:MAG: aminomethyl-transferring glycine dehydrogenase subunit GcvPB [Bacillota bacterium]|jgi:glycine dehydrogenase subunit 2|nr:aminomethyl-transferring glycine dehydrogenase subunit GcvPB [Bacillota bacterium]NLJ02143.1 aminomethyl-transferring glycine dehydrogenase subunit GcvPB [Bacillota bacterium]